MPFRVKKNIGKLVTKIDPKIDIIRKKVGSDGCALPPPMLNLFCADFMTSACPLSSLENWKLFLCTF